MDAAASSQPDRCCGADPAATQVPRPSRVAIAAGVLGVAILAAGLLGIGGPGSLHPARPVALVGELSDGAALTGATMRIYAPRCEDISTGTGFAIDSHTIITNRHVVEHSDGVAFTDNSGGFSAEADRVQGVPGTDLAVLHSARRLPAHLTIGEDPSPGDEVRAIGYPGGGPLSQSVGQVMDITDDRRYGVGGVVVRAELSVSQGSSGGPLLDGYGHVAGVVFAYENSTGAALALGASTLARIGTQAALEPLAAPEC